MVVRFWRKRFELPRRSRPRGRRSNVLKVIVGHMFLVFSISYCIHATKRNTHFANSFSFYITHSHTPFLDVDKCRCKQETSVGMNAAVGKREMRNINSFQRGDAEWLRGRRKLRKIYS